MSELPPLFINRELSWLAFNRRVLEEALDPTLPLLERVKFLAIVSSNLDEFFMVRVGGLQSLVEQNRTAPDPAGMTPAEQLREIGVQTRQMVGDQYACYLKDLEPALRQAGIRRLQMNELTPDQDVYIERLFEHEIYPLLTPISVGMDEPFPLLPGQRVNLAVRLRQTKSNEESGRFAVIAVPRGLARFITVPTEKDYHYILMEDVIIAFLSRLFPGEPILEGAPFRITRNADMSVREDLASDLLEQMKEVLTERRQSSCVRLEISDSASPAMVEFLKTCLNIRDDHIYRNGGPLDFSAYFRLAGMPSFDALKVESWPPNIAPAFANSNDSFFDVISRGDVLLFHPYESFEPVIKMLEEAATDPNVLAIKQILYRTSENSPIVAALARAAERDKHVTVIVELKARFDEARNIEWATALEHAGVQVIYGLRRLKCHAKVCIVVRREFTGIKRYIHFGTGNYNENTARLYSDVGFMTCSEDYAADASAFFNTITGYSQPVRFRKIEAAPLGMRARFLELIDNETERRKQGQKGLIMAKVNSLVDAEIIQALYRASKAGVQIKLNVRGICCLRPGLIDLSENIRVVSIVDRFLEHSRIYYFHNGGDPQVLISSADWMTRNLDKRVELLVPVEDEPCRRRLMEILETCFADNVKARQLQTDGLYKRLIPPGEDQAIRCQEVFYRRAREAARRAEEERVPLFQPQRPGGGEGV